MDLQDRVMIDVSTLAGVDEAGRGPIAGDVYAAAVILPRHYNLTGLTDSKKLSDKKKDRLFDEIRDQALAYAITKASLEEIESLNILHASLLAMKRAVESLKPSPAYVLVDGNRVPDFDPSAIFHAEPLIKGDERCDAVSAASILAKVARDRAMLALHEQYPMYGFAQHKGYPTKAHLLALQMHGVSCVHRQGFGPVARLLKSGTH